MCENCLRYVASVHEHQIDSVRWLFFFKARWGGQKGYLHNILYTKANVAPFPQFKFGGLVHKYKSRNIAFRFSFLGRNFSISV